MRLGLPLLCAVLGLSLLVWNGGQYIDAKPTIRTKDLAFLPGPDEARLLAVGHAACAAKLRWIDSFQYFQLQLDVRDDAKPGLPLGATYRLYDTLVSLDPHFVPFYNHAVLNLTLQPGRDHLALGFLQRGLLAEPHDSGLWRQTAALLSAMFQWETRNPRGLDDVLSAWSDAELTPEGKQMVWDWKAAMARRTALGIEQIGFWLDQLAHANPASEHAAFVTATLREQLAVHGAGLLTAALASANPAVEQSASQSATAADPAASAASFVFAPSGDSLHAPQDWAVLVPRILARTPRELLLQGLAPIARAAGPGASASAPGPWFLRTDPYGHAWILQGGAVLSTGHERVHLGRRIAGLNIRIGRALSAGKPAPQTLGDLNGLGIALPPLPPEAELRFNDSQLSLTFRDAAVVTPWDLRMRR